MKLILRELEEKRLNTFSPLCLMRTPLEIAPFGTSLIILENPIPEIITCDGLLGHTWLVEGFGYLII